MLKILRLQILLKKVKFKRDFVLRVRMGNPCHFTRLREVMLRKILNISNDYLSTSRATVFILTLLSIFLISIVENQAWAITDNCSTVNLEKKIWTNT